MKRTFLLLLCASILLSLCACGLGESGQPGQAEINVELSIEDFADGNHKRGAEYMAAFKTKSVVLDGISIHFATDVFDLGNAPGIAEEIAENYYALQAYDNGIAASVEIYVVGITTTGGPVKLGQKLYISTDYLENDGYLPYLVSVVYGLGEWWKCVGLSEAACNETLDEKELASELGAYLEKNADTYLLSLHPCFFIDDFADEQTCALAKRCVGALAEFIIAEDGFAAFAADSGAASRERWLGSMGLSFDLSWLDSDAAVRLDKMEFSETKRIPMILSEADFRLNMDSVDWIPDAESTYRFLLDFAGQLDAIYARFETEAPEFYASLQENSDATAVNFRDNDYPLSSRASMLKAETIASDDADVLHEIVHTFMPRANIEEAYWLCEGLVTYLTAPLVPYFADSIVVDSVMREYDGDTEEDILFRAETVRCFEKLNGFGISVDMAEPIFKIYEAAGYAAFLNPESTSTPVATQSIKDNYADRHAYNLKSGYPGNELSYCQSMVFVDWLVEKYGLERLIFAEMDAGCYFELFPDAKAFEAEFAQFWAERIEPLAE